MAGRILGHGDIVELVRQTQEIVDHEEQAQLEEKLKKGEFTLDDFRSQLEKMAKPGLMMKMMGLMPGAGELKEMMQNEDAEKDAKRLMGIIDSMTPNERRNPKIIEPSRRMRIANGAGVQPQQVNELVKQYETMKPIVTGMGGKGMKERLKMVQEMQESGMMNPGARGPNLRRREAERRWSS